MRNHIKPLSFISLVFAIFLIYSGVKYYNSDDIKFSRYLKKITSIDRVDVKANDVTLYENGVILKSYFDREQSYLVLDLLHEIPSLNQGFTDDSDNDYSYGIWNAIETSEAIYSINLAVSRVNYNIKIIEINIDKNNNKFIKVTRYFKANEKSTAILKELLKD